MKFLTHAIFTISIASALPAFAQISDCDRLASSPQDPQKQSAGVSYSKIDHIAAVPACKIAITENKQAPRLWFQYGRALEKANKLPDAIIAYQEAAKLGSGAAHNNIGELYRDGKGFGADSKLAEEFFKKAADLNSLEGRDNLLSLQNKNKLANTKTEPESPSFLFEVQLAAYKTKEEATLKINELSKIKIFAYISVHPDNSIFRVRRGPFVNLEDANKDAGYLLSNGINTTVIKLNSNQALLSLATSNSERIKKEQVENSARNSSKENNPSNNKDSKSGSSNLKVGIQCIQKYDSNPGRFSLYVTDKNGFYVWSSGEILPLSNIRFSDEYLTFEQPVYVNSKRYPEAYVKFRVNRNTLDANSRFEVKLAGDPMVTANDYSCKLIDKEQAYTRFLEVNRQHEEFIRNYDAKTKNDKESQLQNRKF
jgi:hypothetical protein